MTRTPSATPFATSDISRSLAKALYYVPVAALVFFITCGVAGLVLMTFGYIWP